MKLSDGEKIILLMLTEIYEKLGVKGGVDPDFIQSAIYDDCVWGIGWKYSHLHFENKSTPEYVKEVSDILSMWTTIELSYEKLSDADKKLLKEKAGSLGENPKFEGFDGNNETEHIGAACFLVEKLGRFDRFKGRGDLNSHSPVIDMYRRMYSVFMPMRTSLMGKPLNVDQLAEIMRAQIHPDYR